MNIRNTIIEHYKKFFDLHAKGIALTEDDYLDIDWAENLVKDCFIPDVSVSFDSLIDRLERASNIKYPNRQWTALFKAEQKMNWKGKDKLLLERVERLESELYER